MVTELDRIAGTVRALMAPYSGAWALCGGWAVDIWLNEITREHGDIDIAVFRDEHHLFADQLADWGLVAHETDDADHQVAWDGHALVANAHLHAARDLEPRRELLLNERGEGGWLLGRWTSTGDRAASLPLHRFALPSPMGIPVMAPEAIAFYKAVGDRRPHDDEDLQRLMTLLTVDQRAWLEMATSPEPQSP